MPRDVEAAIEGLKQRLQDSAEIADDDRRVITEFNDAIEPTVPQDIGLYRHRKLLRSLILLAERHGGLAGALENRDAAEDLKAYIDEEYPNEESNRDMRSILYRFGDELSDGSNPPESIAWIPTTYSSSYDPTPDPREILLWEDDIKPMLQAATNPRDKAMVTLQFDAGLRGGEFKALRRRDIQDHEHGLKVTVDGKQGRRSVLLVKAAESVTEWLAAHPGTDPEAPVWSKLGRPEGVSDTLLYKQFNRLADRAGVEKPVTLTNFRKSSAAFLARRNVSQAHIEDHHGWVRGSDAAARYIQVFGADTDREIARVHGVDVSDEEPDAVHPQRCPRCEASVEPHREFCAECNQALDREAHRVVEKAVALLDEKAVQADAQEERRALIDAREDIQRNPGETDIDELHQLVSSID